MAAFKIEYFCKNNRLSTDSCYLCEVSRSQGTGFQKRSADRRLGPKAWDLKSS